MPKCIWTLIEEPDARSWIFSLIETLKHEDLIPILVTLLRNLVCSHEGYPRYNIFKSTLSTFPFVNVNLFIYMISQWMKERK